jgi:uncharacterized membrane protein
VVVEFLLMTAETNSENRARAGNWRPDRRAVFVLVILAASIGAFLLAPWSLQEKSIAALHGLCAQQPTHSFWFGDSRLPFDARMTGIYGGFLIVTVYLLARGRLYYTGAPPASLLMILAGFVALMGIDGVNSTLNDFGFPHVYEPSNHLRYFTGAMTGTAMAVFTWLVAGGVIWSPAVASTKPIMRGPKELITIAVLVAMFWALLQINAPILFPPLAVTLVIAAVTVIASLALVSIRLAGGAFQQAVRPADLTRSSIVAILVAYAVMSAISGARFMLEAAVVV